MVNFTKVKIIFKKVLCSTLLHVHNIAYDVGLIKNKQTNLYTCFGVNWLYGLDYFFHVTFFIFTPEKWKWSDHIYLCDFYHFPTGNWKWSDHVIFVAFTNHIHSRKVKMIRSDLCDFNHFPTGNLKSDQLTYCLLVATLLCSI